MSVKTTTGAGHRRHLSAILGRPTRQMRSYSVSGLERGSASCPAVPSRGLSCGVVTPRAVEHGREVPIFLQRNLIVHGAQGPGAE